MPLELKLEKQKEMVKELILLQVQGSMTNGTKTNLVHPQKLVQVKEV